jgi:uracil-DNA glycosylase
MTPRLKRKQQALQDIAEEIAKCRVCKKDKVGLPVPGEGNPDADIVFLGEAPGKNEAKTGRPFIGRAGKLLRELIKEAGLGRERCFYHESGEIFAEAHYPDSGGSGAWPQASPRATCGHRA